MSVGKKSSKAIPSKVEKARVEIIQSLPLDKYLRDNKWLYDNLPSGKINCPVHEERTPSCFYDAEKGVYHCFGCGSKGTVVELAYAMDKKVDEKANQIRTILALSKKYDIKITNMFEYDKVEKPVKRKRVKFDKKKIEKHEDLLYLRKLEKMEQEFKPLSIPNKLKVYRVIDKVFLNELEPKEAFEKLTTFLESIK